MTRKLFAYGLLLVTIFWLVASYIPEHILLLPKASLEGIISSPTQRIIFTIIMVVFVGIQISLIFSTNRLFGSQAIQPELDVAEIPSLVHERTNKVSTMSGPTRAEQFGLKRSSELLWTSVPAIMTLVTLLLAFTVFS